MQIKKPKKATRKYIVIGVIVLVIAAGLAAYFAFTKPSTDSNSSIDYGPASEEQKDAGNAIKKQTATGSTSKPSGSTGSDQSTTPTPQANGKSGVSMYITSKAQNGSTLHIGSDISTVTKTGTCTLSFTKDGKTVTKTASVQALASSSTCMGFDVPVSELSQGSWQITLHFENDKLVADATDTVVVQ